MVFPTDSIGDWIQRFSSHPTNFRRVKVAISFLVGDNANFRSGCLVNIIQILGTTGSSEIVISGSDQGFTYPFLCQQVVPGSILSQISWNQGLTSLSAFTDNYMSLRIFRNSSSGIDRAALEVSRASGTGTVATFGFINLVAL